MEMPPEDVAEVLIPENTPAPVGPKTLRTWVTAGMDDEVDEQPVSYRIQGRERRTARWDQLCDVRVKRDETVEELADRIEVEVTNQTSKHMQVAAFRRRARAPASVFPIIGDLYGPDEDDDQGDDRSQYSSEKAYAAIIKQTLSHNEKMVNAVMRMAGAQTNAMGVMVQRYEAREERVQRDHMEALDALHVMATTKADDDSKSARWNAGIGAVKDIAQAISLHLTNGSLQPDAKSKVMSAGLKRLGASLNEEQVTTISRTLTPQQAVLLQSLLQDPEKFADRVIQVKQEGRATEETDANEPEE
jgi:hypothetical protein